MNGLRLLVLCFAIAVAVGACAEKPSANGRAGTERSGAYVGVGAGFGF